MITTTLSAPICRLVRCFGTCEAVSTSPSAPTVQAISCPPTPDKASQVLRDDEQMELEALIDHAAEPAEAANNTARTQCADFMV